jgi:hypothetical protein
MFIIKNHRILLSLVLLIALKIELLNAGGISLVRTFETWNAGIIKSTDPAGIVYHPPSGHLFISDSEINEIAAIWNCENIFEINLAGDQVFDTFDSYNPGGQSCPPTTNSNNREPTGITFNEFDGFFYVSDDGEHSIMSYDNTFGASLVSVVVPGADFEGITSDPSTGYLYTVIGMEGINKDGVSRVLVYNSNLDFLNEFSVEEIATDPEGIAFSFQLNHLFILSGCDKKIFEFTLDGNLVKDYDICNFLPTPDDPQGLTFAPSSDPNDDPSNYNLYIVDGQKDNNPNPENDRDGLIYEATIDPINLQVRTETYSIPTIFGLSQNYPNPFNPETQFRFQLPVVTHVDMRIYNVHGQEILRLLSGTYATGTYIVSWDGKDDHGNLVPSGVHFYQLQAGEFFQVKKMNLLK